ncbi:hypothetical protein J6590_102809 [Homalodisca vitripennis]|nr:hypothetical protein J6590_102809 [Homalodisca vitripennis]
MDFRINVIRQILEAHVAPREEAATVTRLLGGAQQPLRLSGRHFPRPLPELTNDQYSASLETVKCTCTSLHQELHEDDYVLRTNFCLWSRDKMHEDEYIFRKVLWCDETTFRSNGEVNLHNMRFWAFENPQWMRECEIVQEQSLENGRGGFKEFVFHPWPTVCGLLLIKLS